MLHEIYRGIQEHCHLIGIIRSTSCHDCITSNLFNLFRSTWCWIGNAMMFLAIDLIISALTKPPLDSPSKTSASCKRQPGHSQGYRGQNLLYTHLVHHQADASWSRRLGCRPFDVFLVTPRIMVSTSDLEASAPITTTLTSLSCLFCNSTAFNNAAPELLPFRVDHHA